MCVLSLSWPDLLRLYVVRERRMTDHYAIEGAPPNTYDPSRGRGRLMFHANDRHSPHWSEDFVEHIRTVHFSLVAVCLALIGLLQFEKPKDVKTAQSQLQEIKLTLDAWNSEQGAGAVSSSFQNAAGNIYEMVSFPFPGFEIFQQDVGIGDFPLVWVPPEKTGEGESLKPRDFLGDKIMKKPSSLADFREFWDLLSRKPQLWTMDHEHLSDRLVIVASDGSVSTIGYKSDKPLSSLEILAPTLSDEHQRRIISTALHTAPPECVYSYSKGGSTMLLPVSVSLKKEFDGQAALIGTHTYWKSGVFSKSFAELDAATAGKQNSSFESIASDLAAEAAKPKSDSFEIFGVKFPVESASRWGIVLILGIQLYLWIHLYEISPKLKKGDPGWDVAWIGVYQSLPAKTLFFASTVLLPLLTIVALGHHALTALGSHASHAAGLSVWAIYISAALASLVLSVLISKGIPEHYDAVRRT